ncbi:MAG: glycerol-3-phosphate acyltransferase [Chloroflexi bacterium]|nr:glycerol-3-phosphate acyltransferase [Chloroflexota bacterium]
MKSVYHILATVIGYLLGSLPVGYLVGKLHGVDVRQHGSGRTGGTNVWRATGQIWPPLLTVLGDIGKGLLAVWLGRRLAGSELAAALAGAAAVFGHNWPVFLRFKGGGGGITAGACLVMLNWVAGAITVPLAILALYLSRYASVGTLSVGGGGLLVLLTLRLAAPGLAPTIHLLYGLLAAAWIVWALRPNIRRLLRGTERRITLW